MKFHLLIALLLVLAIFSLQINAREETTDSDLAIAIKDRAVYGNRSKIDIEGYLLERGYSKTESDNIIKNVSTGIVREAFERNISKEYIAKGFRDRGFTPDEIETIIHMIALEQTKNALSEGTSLETIRSDLKSKGFTTAEINDIIKAAKSQLPNSGAKIPLILWIIPVIIISAILFFLWKRRKPKEIPSPGISTDSNLELLKLQSEKSNIEEMIRIAKTKYHKRKLDEESFREIIRDHQKKLIEIEAKINQIEKRVQRLEKR